MEKRANSDREKVEEVLRLLIDADKILKKSIESVGVSIMCKCATSKLRDCVNLMDQIK